MPLPPKRDLGHLAEAPHGSLDYQELERRGINPDEIVDFSSNVNSFGPSPKVAEALRQVDVGRYPDRDSLLLRRAIADALGVSIDRLIAGNGSSELLHLVAQAWLQSGDRALIVGPTYGEYARVAKLCGAETIAIDGAAKFGFVPPVAEISRRLRDLHPRLCFVCNPNNPTGQFLDPGQIHDWAGQSPETLFVIDEAYLEFVPELTTAGSESRENLIVLRSLTKAHGLAGLRLGYAIASPGAIANLLRVRSPWSVNSLAQAAGIAALADHEHVRQSVAQLIAAKAQLVPRLAALGLAAVPSATPYFLLPVRDATGLRDALLDHKLLVRDCTSFGLPAHVRIMPRSEPDNDRLVEVLAASA
jgi:histidinol-phosphate aminotransferase